MTDLESARQKVLAIIAGLSEDDRKSAKNGDVEVRMAVSYRIQEQLTEDEIHAVAIYGKAILKSELDDVPVVG